MTILYHQSNWVLPTSVLRKAIRKSRLPPDATRSSLNVIDLWRNPTRWKLSCTNAQTVMPTGLSARCANGLQELWSAKEECLWEADGKSQLIQLTLRKDVEDSRFEKKRNLNKKIHQESHKSFPNEFFWNIE